METEYDFQKELGETSHVEMQFYDVVRFPGF